MDHVELNYNGLDFVMDRDKDLYTIGVTDQKGREAGRCIGCIQDFNFNDNTVKAMVVGRVRTYATYRRLGMARKTFQMLDDVIRERGVLVSYLHPFSFPYYRNMGYERVSDHRVLEFDFDALDFLPRYADLERILPEDSAEELDLVYNEFAKGRNIMPNRIGSGLMDEAFSAPRYMFGMPYIYGLKGKACYLCRDDAGCPDGYIIVRRELCSRDHYQIGSTLHVEEMCFTTPEALRKLLGFVRMFEGECDHIRIANCGMAPEVERVLRKYKYTKITVLPDISGRVHDVGGLLKASRYPKERGEFTVRVTDCEKSPFSKDLTEGVWNVAYGNGTGTVTRLEDNAPCDLTLAMPAFTQLVHGFESYGADVARYMEGVQLHTDCYDFFHAFPNRPAGSFDLF